MSRLRLLLASLVLIPGVAFAHGPGRMGNAIGQEIMVDAPWRVVSDVIPVLVGVHDANAGLVSVLTHVKIWEITPQGTELRFETSEPGHPAGTNTWFNTDLGSPYMITSSQLNNVGDKTHLKVDVEWKIVSPPLYYTNTVHLYVRRGALDQGEHLPTLPGWYPGDVHYHTEFTGQREDEVNQELVEFGGPINFLPWAMNSVGLRWLTTTDHAMYLDNTRWDQLNQTIQTVQAGTSRALNTLILRGEEASPWDMYDDLGISLHTLVYGHANYIEMNEFTPSNDLADLSDAAQAQGAFSYGAHPMNGFALAGAHLWSAWRSRDFATAFETPARTAIKGIQIWNVRDTKTSVEFEPRNTFQPFPVEMDPAAYWKHNPLPSTLKELLQGLAKWDELLMRSLAKANRDGALPRKIFVSGGSDAHGDCNYGVSYFGKFGASENAIGKPRTYVSIPSGFVSQANVLDSLSHGRAIMTDGPIVIFGVDTNNNGKIDWTEPNIGGDKVMNLQVRNRSKLIIQWESTEEFGPVERLRVLRGEEGLAKGRPKAILPGNSELQPDETYIPVNPPQLSGTLSIPLAPYLPNNKKWYYFRVEAYSKVGEPIDSQPQPIQITFQDDTQSPVFTMDDWWPNFENYTGETFRAYTNPIWLKLDPVVIEVSTNDLLGMTLGAVVLMFFTLLARRRA